MNLKIRNKIIKIINKIKIKPERVLDETNLHLDLGIDSLAFIQMLLTIEKTFSISFNIFEMGNCLIFKNLINIVENKLKEA